MEEETQIRLSGLSAESTFARAERKLKGQGEKTYLQILKKIQAKEKRERKRKMAQVVNQETPCLSVEDRGAKNEESPGCDKRQKPTPHMPRCSTPFSYNLNIYILFLKYFHLAIICLWVRSVFLCATEHMWNSEDNS